MNIIINLKITGVFMNRIAWFNIIAFAGTLITYVAEKLSAFFGG